MSIESREIYELAPTTQRSGDFLARKHGHKDVEQLAASLPPYAQVLDIGAGASPFGKEVAALRNDILWTNFDYSYHDQRILETVEEDTPDNVRFVKGDATKLTDYFENDSFDALFSYWLMPHLSIDNVEPAQAAASGIYRVTKTGGEISVGPKRGYRTPSAIRDKSMRFIKTDDMSEGEFVDVVVRGTRLTPVVRFAQKTANQVATPFFGTSHYATKTGRIPRILNISSGEYVSPFSADGIKTIGKLAVATARHAVRR